MSDTAQIPYSSKIIKAGALLADTKTFLAHWDQSRSVQDNLERFQRENIFGKASRSRVEDILPIFRQRYLQNEAVTQALVILVQRQFPTEALDRILYFLAAQSDRLLHDIVVDVLLPYYLEGRLDIGIEQIHHAISRWVAEGKTTRPWNEETSLRVAQGLAATLRDFDILQGTVKNGLPHLLAAPGVGLSAAGVLLLATASYMPVILLSGTLMALGSAAFASVNWALTIDLTPPAEAARFLGLANIGTAGALLPPGYSAHWWTGAITSLQVLAIR